MALKYKEKEIQNQIIKIEVILNLCCKKIIGWDWIVYLWNIKELFLIYNPACYDLLDIYISHVYQENIVLLGLSILTKCSIILLQNIFWRKKMNDLGWNKQEMGQ